MDNTFKPDNKLNIGSILVSGARLKPTDIEKVLKFQQQNNVRFGEAAKALNLIAEFDIEWALAIQFGYPLLSPNDDSLDKSLVMAYQPHGPDAEPFRNLREHLDLHWFTENKSLMVVGQTAQDASVYTAGNLAIAFAQLGKSVLLIDADFFNAQLHSLFKIGNQFGLSDLIAGRSEVTVLKQIDSIGNLFLLTSGAKPPNTAELISRGLKKVVETLAQRFDIIIVSASPNEAGIEAKLTAKAVGGAIFVLEKHETRLNDIRNMKDNFLEVGCECLGVLLSDE